MKNLLLLILAGCGQDITGIEIPQGGYDRSIPTESYVDAGRVSSTHAMEPSGKESSYQDAEIPTLCLHVAAEPSEFFLRVRASATRFRERLGIPVAICDTGVPILVQDHVWQSPGHGLGGKATYDGTVCRFAECNTGAHIEIAQHETELPDTIDGILDHEIGHVLSAWGKFSKKTDGAGHLVPGNLMQGGLLPPHQKWTQADIDLWCSASPCSKTNWQDETTDSPDAGPPVVDSDSGTSGLSNGGLSDATAPIGDAED